MQKVIKTQQIRKGLLQFCLVNLNSDLLKLQKRSFATKISKFRKLRLEFQ